MDRAAIEEHVRGIIRAIGDDPDREGLRETPARVARMCEEIFEGNSYTNDEIAEMFSKSFESPSADDIVLVRIEEFASSDHLGPPVFRIGIPGQGMADPHHRFAGLVFPFGTVVHQVDAVQHASRLETEGLVDGQFVFLHITDGLFPGPAAGR